jgi:aryl-alcohol dehydrogenase-like predicted oxidoreductase
MDKIRLGGGPLEVGKVCLGTMTFGEQVDEATAFAILDRALERGIDFIDTAEMYSVPARRETYGTTEAILGPSSAAGSTPVPACASGWCWPARWPARREGWTGCAAAATT